MGSKPKVSVRVVASGLALALAIAVPTFAPARTATTVHAAGSAPLPATRLEFGLANGPGERGWMTSSGVPWKYRYQYLSGGANTPFGQGWETWNSPPGAFATFYMDDSDSHGYIPVFTYYELLQSLPSTGGTEQARDYSNLNNTSTMNSYYTNFALLMTKAKAFGKTVIVHIEPDLFAYMEHQAAGGDASAVSASVASSGYSGFGSLPNTFQGFCWGLLMLRDSIAPNVLLATHASNWASGVDIGLNTNPSFNLAADADAVAAFLGSAGVSTNSHASTFDLVFNDVADNDASLSMRWWDRYDTSLPDFQQWLTWMTELHARTARQVFVWQVPVGNQYFDTMNLSPGHSQDNRAEYFLSHVSALQAAGIIGVLFGSGGNGGSTYTDAKGDGVTNASPVATFECNLCNNHMSVWSDDDGGYLRIFVGQYYASTPTVPGAPTGVAGTAIDAAATLTWSAPISNGGSAITSYAVTAYDGCTVQGSMTVRGPPATLATFTGLTNGSAYSFKVAAANIAGMGPQSTASGPVTPSGASTPAWVTACSASQYTLAGSNGVSWMDVDASNLNISFRPAVDSYAVLSGNVDLWTANAGFNQDVGIAITGGVYPKTTGQPEAWKESGGFAGTFSPNAAFVQAVIPVMAATTYSAGLQWKANKPDAGTIFAGAGPIAGGFSPTRLTVQLVPKTTPATAISSSTTSQYSLSGSDGSVWMTIDAPNLSVSFTPPAGNWLALVSGNADLWTSSAGFNQDIGVSLTGGGYPTATGQPEAWKESGGFAGTFSPNAAFVQASLSVVGGTQYKANLKWKSNRPDPGTIYAGAGPINAHFSPTTLTVILVPNPAGPMAVSSAQQYTQTNSDGNSWKPVDLTTLKVTIPPGTATSYMISGNSDLWTQVAGYNQDIGIMVSGGAYSSGTLVAWKESGGFAGTFSPNAALVVTDLHLQSGTTYTIWVVWKANRAAQVSNAIVLGAGPINGKFSPTSLTAVQLSQP